MPRRRFMVFDGAPDEYEERRRRGVEDFQERILAVWEVAAGRPGEADWIERLAVSKDADRVFRHPRHDRYTSHAFFVRRLGLWTDIAAHWDRRKALAAMRGNSAAVPASSVWVVVSFFSPERFIACPPEAILTIDAVDTVVPLR